MSFLDRLFPDRARQRAELAAARAEYHRTLADRRASRLEVAAEAAANIDALEAALTAARRAAAEAEAASLSPPPMSTDDPTE